MSPRPRPEGWTPLTREQINALTRARYAEHRAVLVEDAEHQFAMGASRWAAARALGYRGDDKSLLALSRVFRTAGRDDLARVFAAGLRYGGDPYNQDSTVAVQEADRVARDIGASWLARFADRPDRQVEDGAAQVA